MNSAAKLLTALALLLPLPAFAIVDLETAYVINTFVALICAALVMWMVAGFCMLESGMVSSKCIAVICLKNIVIYSIACLCFYLIGYNLMFVGVDGGWLGSFTPLANMNALEFDLAAGVEEALAEVLKTETSSMAALFFQMVFVATTASVISGSLAQRIKLYPFFIVVAFLTAFIYPIQGAWIWGGGWLSELGFTDFAGSTVVHSVGGWAALTGAYFLGPRFDKYNEDGQARTYLPSSVPLVTLGVFILWLGWFGFNGGSVLITAGAASISQMSLVIMNTNIAACSGVMCALFLGRWLYGRINILLVLNGALAGLVAITAGPDLYQPIYAVMVGAVGSALATLSIPVLDKWGIDDVVGAIPVHLVAGIWGTLAVGIFGPASFMSQLIGVLSVGVFVCATTGLLWFLLKKTIGIRVSEELELLGQDLLELGIEDNPDVLKIDDLMKS